MKRGSTKRKKLGKTELLSALSALHDVRRLLFDRQAAIDYARILEGHIRKYALPATDRLTLLRKTKRGCQSDLLAFMGDREGSHALRAKGIAWLRMFETQVCSGLQEFLLLQPDQDGARALLEALAPEWNWPKRIDDVDIAIEVRCAGTVRGAQRPPRIDMLVTVTSDGKRFGAIVEVKTRGQKVINPLPTYTEFARGHFGPVAKGCIPTDVAFVVLVPVASERLRRRLRHACNRHWRIVEWPAFLRRLEGRLRHDTPDFKQFRKVLWDTLDA